MSTKKDKKLPTNVHHSMLTLSQKLKMDRKVQVNLKLPQNLAKTTQKGSKNELL